MNEISIPNKATLTVRETAEVLGISRNTAYRAIERGEIPTISFGPRSLMVPTAELRKMLGEK